MVSVRATLGLLMCLTCFGVVVFAQVVIDSSGHVSFFFNGRDAGVAFSLPSSVTEVYPFVDLYGKVSILTDR